jgi:hypothetical protein
MPWQAAPSLIIIFGAFNVAAGLIWTVDRCYYGKVRRTKKSLISENGSDIGLVGWMDGRIQTCDYVILKVCILTSILFRCAFWHYIVPHYFTTQRGRTVGHNQWSWAMEKRDERIEQMRALKKD